MNTLALIPPHERRILEAHVRGVSLGRVELEQNELNEYQKMDLKNLIRLRMRGFPLQYLVGTQAFYGRDFYVNTSVLIPRPETEGLVELVLKNIPAHNGKEVLGLDLGTGSGCIALTLCLERADLRMHATECNDDALDVARENMRRLDVPHVNLFSVSKNLHAFDYAGLGPLDFIVSNPPYLSLHDEIASDVRENEPEDALYAPESDPLAYYRFLADLVATHLAADGFACFEFSHDRASETREVFSSRGWFAEVYCDLTDRPRYLVVKKKRQDI